MNFEIFIDILTKVLFCYFQQNFLIFQDESLWACLAAMAAYHKQLATAEVAYAAIDEVCIQTNTNSLDRNAF